MKVHVVVPARMASTRLPGKPLAEIAGVPMIVRVAQQASQSGADDVVVAVDDMRVAQVVRDAGFHALMTAEDHPSGSDRVMEVAHVMGWPDEDIVINVQGDEPLLPPAVIDQLADHMSGSEAIDVATLSEPITSREDFLNPNIVKVLTDNDDLALYFSRAPIPYPRDAMLDGTLSDGTVVANDARRHVGVYGFRVSALRQFVSLNGSRLEQIECLEQLRWLEVGRRISVLPSAEPIPGGVDTPEDLARIQQVMDAGG